MKTKQNILDSIIKQGILPLFYNEDAELSMQIVRTLYKAGVRTLEYTNRGAAALRNFKSLKRMQVDEMPDLNLGIGTIISIDDAGVFIEAGADFLVSPLINPDVAKFAHDHQLLWIPGCMTPTEIYKAQCLDALLIKLFPANVLGASFLASIKELFRGQLFMPTGGVELNAKNLMEWFAAGVCAVGVGNKLIPNKIPKIISFDDLYVKSVEALDLVQKTKLKLVQN
ncbi:MAG: bifunctional 4-hydroxy-2-oxoglutarate aldolase/2-dehydro-3-deoxy-phosphogluconate aldolase [Mucilaginibacter sp.]